MTVMICSITNNALRSDTHPWLCVALVRVVQNVYNVIQWINHYLMDRFVCFVNTYSRDSDLSGGQQYALFEQLCYVCSIYEIIHI